MKNLGYLVAAYLVFWVATFAYLFSISKRQKEIGRALKDALGKKSD